MTEFTPVVHVDESCLLRLGFAEVLSEFSDFQLVANGASLHDAVALAQNHRSAIIVIDTNIPGNGIEAAKLILRQFPNRIIVFLTASERPEHLLAALSSGAMGYLHKTASSNEIMECLHAVRRGGKYVAQRFESKSIVQGTLGENGHDKAADPQFTVRELEIVTLLKDGSTNREIADALVIAEKTVKNHVSVIMQKLQVRNRVEATRAILRRMPSEMQI